MASAGRGAARAGAALPRPVFIVLVFAVGVLAGAALQSRLGCPAAGAATVCERRLTQKLDAASIAGKDAVLAQRQQQSKQQSQEGEAAAAAAAAEQAEQQQQPAAAAAAAAADEEPGIHGQQLSTQRAEDAQPAAAEEQPAEEGPAEEPAERRPAAAQPGAAPEPAAGPLHPVVGAAPRGRFVPDGYTLPPECEKHEPLYAAVFDHLRPWFERGITRADIDACKAPVAPASHDLKEGSPQHSMDDPVDSHVNPRFRMLNWNNTVLVTSGGLERWDGPGQQPLHYFIIKQVQDAARRFGLPNIEWVVGFGDANRDRSTETSNGFPKAMCPLFTFAKHPRYYNLLLPSGEFVKKDFDEWAERMRLDPGPPWDQRDARAVGRWTMFWTTEPTRTRWGGEETEARELLVKHSNATGHKYIWFADTNTQAHVPLSEQRGFKYAFNTDGFTASTRFSKLLATGQTIIKQDSELIEWFYPALQPWVHYVPSGWNGLEEVDRVVQFLREHDQLARRIAGNAQRFAQTHLVSEGRHCYIKVLFEEVAKLMRYKPKLGDYPTTISYEEDAATYLVDPHGLDVTPE